MQTRAEINEFFDMYETFSKDYITRLATEKAKKLLYRIGGRKNDAYAVDFITVFCGVLSELSGFPYDQYEFFLKISGIKISYAEFQRLTRLNNSPKTLMDMKTFGVDFYFDLSFDFDMMILAVCFCAYNGKISYAEREHMITYVPMPSYTDNRKF